MTIDWQERSLRSSALYAEHQGTGLELGTTTSGELVYRLWYLRGSVPTLFDPTWSTVVQGPLFWLSPVVLERAGSGFVAQGMGSYLSLTGGSGVYPWTLHAWIDDDGWVNLRLEVNLPEPAALHRGHGYEPAFLVELGARPPYDRGHTFWAQTEVLGYTLFDGTPNNDLPALYYRDPLKRARVLMFFELSSMAWMGSQTLARFRDYRLGQQEYGGERRHRRLGMYGVSASGDTWPAGVQVLAYRLHVQEEPLQTSDVQALEDLLNHLSASFKATPDVNYGVSWRELACGAGRNLAHDGCWRITPSGEWLRPYAFGHSPVWQAVDQAEGKPNENLGDTPYMLWFQEMVLLGLRHGATETALRRDLNAAAERVERSTRHHYGQTSSVFAGYLSSNLSDDVAVGTWQYVHAVANSWRVGRRLGIDSAKHQAENEIRERLLPLLERHAYLPPVTHNRLDLSKVGPQIGYSILGVCAELFTDLAEDDAPGREGWFDLAHKCLHLLACAPVHHAHQEANHLGSAVLAASRLLVRRPSAEVERWIRHLTHQALRQFYWYEEPVDVGNPAGVRLRGLSSCCTPMAYSAFWENISQALAFACAYRTAPPDVKMLSFLNVLREHAKGSVPAALGDHSLPLPFLPNEDLRTLEVALDPPAGQEVYGAGHMIWAYSLFEAFCTVTSAPSSILVLCTNLLDDPLPDRLGERTFLMFNALSQATMVTGNFSLPARDQLVWQVYDASHSGEYLCGTGQHFSIPLLGRGWVKVTVSEATL